MSLRMHLQRRALLKIIGSFAMIVMASAMYEEKQADMRKNAMTSDSISLVDLMLSKGSGSLVNKERIRPNAYEHIGKLLLALNPLPQSHVKRRLIQQSRHSMGQMEGDLTKVDTTGKTLTLDSAWKCQLLLGDPESDNKEKLQVSAILRINDDPRLDKGQGGGGGTVTVESCVPEGLLRTNISTPWVYYDPNAGAGAIWWQVLFYEIPYPRIKMSLPTDGLTCPDGTQIPGGDIVLEVFHKQRNKKDPASFGQGTVTYKDKEPSYIPGVSDKVVFQTRDCGYCVILDD